MVKPWVLGPYWIRKEGRRKQRRKSWDLVWTTSMGEK